MCLGKSWAPSATKMGKDANNSLPLAFDLLNNSFKAKQHLGHTCKGITGESGIAQLHTKDLRHSEEQSEESFLFWACNVREPVSSHSA